MNIKKAWLALWGKLEPVVIPGETSVTRLYRVQLTVPQYIGLWEFSYIDNKYFHTCEQAFVAYPGHRVEEIDVYLIAGRWVIGFAGTEVHPEPKPRVPKGKRKSDGRS